MKYLKGLIGAVLLIVLDQWTKYMVLLHIKPVDSIPLISGVLSFTYHENRGAVWGIMQGQIPILIVSTIIILAVVLWVYSRIPDTKKISMAPHYCGNGHSRGHRQFYRPDFQTLCC